MNELLSTDLKINNFVLDDEGDVVKITRLSSGEYEDWSGDDWETIYFDKGPNEYHQHVMRMGKVYPIKITSEILSLNGWINGNSKYFLNEKYGKIVFEGKISNDGLSVEITCNIMKKEIYLHDLQNLVKLFYKQDLEIKLPESYKFNFNGK